MSRARRLFDEEISSQKSCPRTKFLEASAMITANGRFFKIPGPALVLEALRSKAMSEKYSSPY